MVGNVDLESDNQAGLAQEVLEAMLLGAPTTTPDIPTRTRDPDLTQGNLKKWYFVTKIVLTSTVRKNCSSDREKLLKFEAEGREFAKILRSVTRTISSNSEKSTSFDNRMLF